MHGTEPRLAALGVELGVVPGDAEDGGAAAGLVAGGVGLEVGALPVPQHELLGPAAEPLVGVAQDLDAAGHCDRVEAVGAARRAEPLTPPWRETG